MHPHSQDGISHPCICAQQKLPSSLLCPPFPLCVSIRVKGPPRGTEPKVPRRTCSPWGVKKVKSKEFSSSSQGVGCNRAALPGGNGCRADRTHCMEILLHSEIHLILLLVQLLDALMIKQQNEYVFKKLQLINTALLPFGSH